MQLKLKPSIILGVTFSAALTWFGSPPVYL